MADKRESLRYAPGQSQLNEARTSSPAFRCRRDALASTAEAPHKLRCGRFRRRQTAVKTAHWHEYGQSDARRGSVQKQRLRRSPLTRRYRIAFDCGMRQLLDHLRCFNAGRHEIRPIARRTRFKADAHAAGFGDPSKPFEK